MKRSLQTLHAFTTGKRAQSDIQVVDLGPAQPIETAIIDMRKILIEAPTTIRTIGEADAEKQWRQASEAFTTLVVTPLEPHLKASSHWWLSPDAALWLVPWSALTVSGKYLVEKHALGFVVSGRDLVSAKPRAEANGPAMLFADPDFDLSRNDALRQTRRTREGYENPNEQRSTGRSLPLGKIPRLPGTASEVEAIAPRVRQWTGSAPQVFTDNQALEGIFKTTRPPRLLVFSTHGYFLDEGDNNPLLRCGLLLAGCNDKTPPTGEMDDGVLTGLEIVSTDLRGCELVVLSACETGLGDIRNGEGVAGLRQAFQAAGAESVVASLWQVPDRDTALLMIQFFDQLTAGHGKVDAFCAAQRTIISQRRKRTNAAHPFFWAAFTLTGR
jgi:CHAT domain-containing protein